MKKLLLSCDEFLYYDGESYYAANNEKYDLLKRYLRVFDKVRLVMRCVDESPLKAGRARIDDGRMEVSPVPMFHGPSEYASRYLAIGRQLRSVADDCDAGIFRLPSTLAMRVAKGFIKTGKPYAVEVVYDAYDGFSNAENLLNKCLWGIIHKDLVRVCNGAYGVSCVTESYLQRHYFSRRADAFSSHYSSLALPEAFYSSERPFPQKNEFVVAHVSNQVDCAKRKGHLQLLEAVRLLKDDGIAVKVRFAGPDYKNGISLLLERGEKLGVSDRIEFVGFLDRTELKSFLQDSDLFVFPTLAEGLPRVVIEAMSQGLPCIVSNVSGNPELIEDRYLVSYDDVRGIADRIKSLISDPLSYEEASRVNFEKSKEYEASVLESRRDAFYSELKALTE